MAAVDQLRALTDTGVVERASMLAPSEWGVLAVTPPLSSLLPGAGLRRGTTTTTSGPGATSLALALAASGESWVAAVGMPALGLVSATELGVALDRLVVTPDPGAHWLSVLAALTDAFNVVVARPPRLRERDVRKLSARVREQRSVLIAVGGWTGADLRLAVTSAEWFGIGCGHGHLAARRLTLTVSGRGAASRPRRATIWLPDGDGGVSLDEQAEIVRLPS